MTTIHDCRRCAETLRWSRIELRTLRTLIVPRYADEATTEEPGADGEPPLVTCDGVLVDDPATLRGHEPGALVAVRVLPVVFRREEFAFWRLVAKLRRRRSKA